MGFSEALYARETFSSGSHARISANRETIRRTQYPLQNRNFHLNSPLPRSNIIPGKYTVWPPSRTMACRATKRPHPNRARSPLQRFPVAYPMRPIGSCAMTRCSPSQLPLVNRSMGVAIRKRNPARGAIDLSPLLGSELGWHARIDSCY